MSQKKSSKIGENSAGKVHIQTQRFQIEMPNYVYQKIVTMLEAIKAGDEPDIHRAAKELMYWISINSATLTADIMEQIQS